MKTLQGLTLWHDSGNMMHHTTYSTEPSSLILTHSSINYSACRDKHGLWGRGSVETIYSTFSCNLQKTLGTWHQLSRAYFNNGRRVGGSGNRAMEGWKQFVLCNILVYKSSRSIYGSPTSNEHTVLDEIRKPHSAAAERTGGIITRRWCQIPRLPRCFPPPRDDLISDPSLIFTGEKMKHVFFALWSTSWISLDEHRWLLTTQHPERFSQVVRGHAGKCRSGRSRREQTEREVRV